MDDSSASAPPPAAEAVPINIAPSTDGAPPTLAEPASGPVATMSGALQGPDAPEAPKTSVESTGTSYKRLSASISHPTNFFSLMIDPPANGSTELAAEAAPTDVQPSDPTKPAVAAKDDAEMDEPAPPADTEAPEANGTPAAS